MTSSTAGTADSATMPWPAPRATGPVSASVRLPGSKSLTNRGLILSALATGPSTLRAPLRSRDTELMAGGVAALGPEVVADDEVDGGAWRITPHPLRGPAEIDCGLAGTVMRFMPPLAALTDGPVRFDGDPAARTRPMDRLLAALRSLGAEVDDDGRGALPFTLVGRGGLAGGEVTIDASASSQFVSGLLLAGAAYDKGLVVRHSGPPMPSAPHVEMTVATLRDVGVVVDDSEPLVWRVAPGPIRPLEMTIEPDLSNAAPFLAAAVVTGGSVHVPDWPLATTQPGDSLRDLLTRMGASTTLDATGLTVTGGASVHGIDVDLRDTSELVPVLAAVAAMADTPSRLRGIGHMRGHETDRLAALTRELTNLGGDVTEHDDGVEIRPRPLNGAVFATYDDHRMAQAAAVLGLVVDGIGIENVGTTRKTLPDFVGMWTGLLGGSGGSS